MKTPPPSHFAGKKKEEIKGVSKKCLSKKKSNLCLKK
jgi:hypothetical protein